VFGCWYWGPDFGIGIGKAEFQRLDAHGIRNWKSIPIPLVFNYTCTPSPSIPSPPPRYCSEFNYTHIQTTTLVLQINSISLRFGIPRSIQVIFFVCLCELYAPEKKHPLGKLVSPYGLWWTSNTKIDYRKCWGHLPFTNRPETSLARLRIRPDCILVVTPRPILDQRYLLQAAL
jgi:hypothetical protein